MAEDDQQVCEPRGQQHGFFANAAIALTLINHAMASVFHAATRDGTLAAAFRQGAGEAGQALKAFPDSIQVHEPGTILNPTQGEIAASRDSHAPSPSEIARGDAGTVHGPVQAHSQAAPLPSDIARGNGDTVHGPQQGNVQAPPSPSDIARGNGQVLTQEEKPPGYWTDRIDKERKGNQDGNADNDQNERGKGRSLPEEQKEKEKEQEQDRGRGR